MKNYNLKMNLQLFADVYKRQIVKCSLQVFSPPFVKRDFPYYKRAGKPPTP